MEFQLTITGSPDNLMGLLMTATDLGRDVEPKKDVEYAAITNEAEAKPELASAPEPTSEEIPSMETVRTAMMAAIKGGARQEVSDLLAERGAKRVTELPESELLGFWHAEEALI